MTRYAVLLVAPLIIGSVIAIAVLLINGLRERRERTRGELYEAGRVKSAASSIDLAARSAREDKEAPAGSTPVR